MARRELGAAALKVAQAVRQLLPPGPVTVGVSGGADSMALLMGAAWAAPRVGAELRAVVIDHGLQPGSAATAAHVVADIQARGIVAEMRTVHVKHDGGLEAAAREARLEALSRDGHPVLLGHSLDDQAETVLLGLLRGSGLRSIAGMATRRGLFLRPLLGLRRAELEQACREWGIQWWNDPMNNDQRFARVRARSALALLSDQLGRDLAVNLARTAQLAARDADFLGELAAQALAEVASDPASLPVSTIADLAPAIRGRVLLAWLRQEGLSPTQIHVDQVEQLVTSWRGQGPINLPGGTVARCGDQIQLQRGSRQQRPQPEG